MSVFGFSCLQTTRQPSGLDQKVRLVQKSLLRGLSLTEEDAGERELQRGRHHLLRQGLEFELDIGLCGHRTGVLLHVYTAGGQGLPPPRWRLLDRKTRDIKDEHWPILLNWSH